MWVMTTHVQIRSAANHQRGVFGVGLVVGGLGAFAWVMRFQAWWVMWATPTRHTPYTIRIVAYTSNFD
jgi:hypothetical protein